MGIPNIVHGYINRRNEPKNRKEAERMTSITEVKEYILKSNDIDAMYDIRLWAIERIKTLKNAREPESH